MDIEDSFGESLNDVFGNEVSERCDNTDVIVAVGEVGRPQVEVYIVVDAELSDSGD